METSAETFTAPNLIAATGFADRPYRPTWPGEERFGDICHSSAYRNLDPYAGKKVLVVGFGNSGAEIALDLAEKGVEVALAVRGPVNIVPRDLFGLPILSVSILLRPLSPALADALATPLVRLSVGSLKRLGLERPSTGPLAAVGESGRVPVLDVGTVTKIREGAISIRPDIRALDEGTVEFADGRREAYDTIIAATGFRPNLRELLPQVNGALRDGGIPFVSGRQTTEPSLSSPMSSPPALPDPADCTSPIQAGRRDEDAQYYRQVLHELVEIGTRLARAVHRQATTEPAAAPDPTIAFERIARTIRRTILLARTLSDPAQPSPAAQAHQRRTAARKQIIREVEDSIEREADCSEADALTAELYERLDDPDLDDDLDQHPVEHIIEAIRRDLGIAETLGVLSWKRRTPQAIREL